MSWGVVFSHASEATTPGLVKGPYSSRAAASHYAALVQGAQPGIRHRLVRRTAQGDWVALGTGETPRQIIDRLSETNSW